MFARPGRTATYSTWGIALQIRWQSSDSSALGSLYDVLSNAARAAATRSSTSTTTTTTTTTTQPPGATATGGIAGPTSGAQPTSDKGSGLSTGSIAAIALGVAIVVLGSLLGVIFLFRRKRKQQAAKSAADLDETGGGGGAAELGRSVSEKPELAATPSEPLSATELGAQDPRTPELPATRLEPAATELETQAPRIPELPGSPVVAPVELNAGQRGGKSGMFVG